ncbi:MAG TPA: hypothetical protein VEL70_09375 [Candidatus Acidoferrum sp.]|nr:hypothetical protein [Candidatus Acidoferrum sp.]
MDRVNLYYLSSIVINTGRHRYQVANTGFTSNDRLIYKTTDGPVVSRNIVTVTIVSNATSDGLDPFGEKQIFSSNTDEKQRLMNMKYSNQDNITEQQTTRT